MCGIAGLIHRGKTSNVGSELQQMLQALKHRGPDSTGYALYADNDGKNFILRFKVGENVGEGSSSVNEDASVSKSGTGDDVMNDDSDPDDDDSFTVTQIKHNSSTTNSDVSSGTTNSNGTSVTGEYGTLVIGADGSYT